MSKCLNIFITLLLSIYILDIYSIVALIQNVTIGQKHFTNITTSYIALFAFLLVLQRFLSRKIFKATLLIFITLLTIVNIFVVGYLVYYSSPLTYAAFQTLLDTNIYETKEYIITMLNYKILIILLILAIPYVLIYIMEPVKIYNIPVLVVLSLTACIIFIFIHDKRWVKREIPILYMIDTYLVTKKDKDIFLQLLAEYDSKQFQFEGITSELNENDNQTFVIVIGESHSRLHSSLYGYQRDTMPRLKAMSDEILTFSNVSSAHIYTSAVLQKVLTFSENETNFNAYNIKNIIDFFKAAGFKTYWLSNQYYIGKHDSAYSAIAYRSDTAVYLNQITGEFLETPYIDDKLLEPFLTALNENVSKKIIFVHFMGSHAPFYARYPKNFGSFTNADGYTVDKNKILRGYGRQESIDTYDNSIEFTDHILAEMISMLKMADNDSYLLYFSDHGVDVYDTDPNNDITRSDANITPPMYEIPFILWMSNKYKQNYPDYTNNLLTDKDILSRYYKTDKVIHSIIDLSRLNSPDCHSKVVMSPIEPSRNVLYIVTEVADGAKSYEQARTVPR